MSGDTTSNLKKLGWVLHAVGVLTLVTAGAAVYSVLHGRLSTEERTCAARIRELEASLQKADGLLDLHRQLRESVATIERRAREARERIPDTPNEAEFLKQLAKAATDADISMEDYRRGTVRAGQDHAQLDVQLKCNGAFAGLCRFLDAIHKFQRISKVSRLIVGADPAADRYSIELTLVIYFDLKSTPESDRGGTHG